MKQFNILYLKKYLEYIASFAFNGFLFSNVKFIQQDGLSNKLAKNFCTRIATN